MGEQEVVEAAAALQRARETGVPVAPVRALLTQGGLAAAYEVQRIAMDSAVASGARIVGWKIGLTAKAVQQQLGVDQPDFGVLMSDTAYGDAEPIPLSRLLQPRIEAEVAFVLERDMPEGPVTAADVLANTAFVVPALEVVDSRIANWDISILDTVADNASAGVFTLGLKPTRLTDVDLREAEMALDVDGNPLSSGSGSACLGHPVNAVVWLANTLGTAGQQLRAGDVILSGALGPMAPVTGSGTYRAHISGLGTVGAEFVTE